MGSGASALDQTLEAKLAEHAPIEHADLYVDGHEGYRDEFHGGKPTYYRQVTGKLSPGSSPSQQLVSNKDSEKQKQLEIQATSHWHRILDNAFSQIDINSIHKPVCPECKRGNHSTNICRLCGTDVTLSKTNLADEAKDYKPKLLWNHNTQEYNRSYKGNSDDEDTYLQTNVPSVDSTDNFKQTRKGTTDDLVDTDNVINKSPTDKITQVGDLDHDYVSNCKVVELVKGISEREKPKQRHSISSMTIMGASANKEELEKKTLEDELRLKAERIEQRKLKAEKERLLLTLKGIINNYDNDKHQSKDQFDDENDESEVEDDHLITAAPEFDLPPVQIELKSRTSTSIYLSYDVSSDALKLLQKVEKAYEGKRIPTYEVMYRPHIDQTKYKSKSNELVWYSGGRRTHDNYLLIKNLLANTPYEFRCRRVKWDKDWGQSVVIRTGPGVPGPPKGLNAKEVTATSILLTWQVPDKDNGLPIVQYIVQMKTYGGNFIELYRGKEKLYLATNLSSNLIHIFEVKAVNKVGNSVSSDRLAIRTLPAGASDMTPWVETIDPRTGKLYYVHPKSNETSWILPKGAIIDAAQSLKNKKQFLSHKFRTKSEALCEDMNVQHHVIYLTVNRSNLLEESFQQLYSLSPDELDAGPIRIRFNGEEGLDAGGLAKDWFAAVARCLIEGSTGLLQLADDGNAIIDIRASTIHKPSESRWLFKSLGVYIAKALIDNQTLGILLSPLLLLLFAGRTIGLRDLEEIDSSFYKGLKWVEENDVSGADLTFSVAYELFGDTITVDLIEDGRNVTVTEENKHEYKALMIEYIARGRFEPAVTSLLEGFNRHIPSNYLSHFTHHELKVLISGQVSIDVNDLLKNIEFSGDFSAESSHYHWLYQILESFDQEMLVKFLVFVSGCPCLPVDGLYPSLMLTSIEGNDSVLPRAHTCFNQLVLPQYSSMRVFEEKLLFALNNSNDGFHIS